MQLEIMRVPDRVTRDSGSSFRIKHLDKEQGDNLYKTDPQELPFKRGNGPPYWPPQHPQKLTPQDSQY